MEIMKRSRLKNKANKTGLLEDLKRYKIQRNALNKLNKKLTSKRNFQKEKKLMIFGIFVSNILQIKVFAMIN